ncbi:MULTISPECIES: sensor histidine kinase [Enterococcus]|uniref:histidine kinase n=1 Tax=Candidatus Enterococcus murrayae TaxID=2815321 RepID=A0ABS3HJK6_9ENTE|nr:HAMP domain-containing sensor histidine kinase [Enterococcus sp. MJM16]MBO0453197.1 HAMP domain-containing histidine kinase [Enterococcus sp. MJM16]
MSGQNNRKFKVVVALYGFLIGIIVLLFLLYPTIYNRFEKQRQDQTMTKVETILKKDKNVSKKLEATTKESAIELIVLKNHRLVYESLPLQGKLSDIKKFVRKENLVFQKTYKYRDYAIWIAFHPQKVQSQFNWLVAFICLLVTLLVVLIILAVYFIYGQLLQPLRKLRESILALKKFNFDQAILITDYKDENGLLADLSTFSKELKSNIDEIGTKFTELELKLQEEQDLSLYKEKLVNSLIHDLKTPLSIMIMSVEMLLENKTIPKSAKNQLEELLERENTMLTSINDILKASNQQVELMPETTIDLIPIIRESLNNFQILIKNKGLFCEINMPQSISLQISKIEAEQLLHNVLSNVINYSPEDAEFTLDIDEKEDQLILTVSNEAEDLEQIDFEHVFDLFYHSQTAKNEFSTGLGMYTIAAIVQKNKGDYTFYPKDGKVYLTIQLPLKGDVS